MENSEAIVVITLTVLVITYRWWIPHLKSSKLVGYFLIPFILLVFWLGLVFYQAFEIEKVYTILTEEYPRYTLLTAKSGEIYKGDKVEGRFTAHFDNLGIIGFRFWTFYRLNDDYIVFRIKEEGSDGWYYENRYKADQFQPDGYFTFGFPAINDSKGKNYVFQLESAQGQPGVAVGISTVDPVYIIKYKYSKEVVASSLEKVIDFNGNKLKNLTNKTQFSIPSFIYLLPLLLYLITLTPGYLIIERNILMLVNRYKDTNNLKHKINKYRQGVVIKVPYISLSSPKLKTYEITIHWYSKAFLSVLLLTLGVIGDIVFVKIGDMTVIILIFLIFAAAKIYGLLSKLFFVYSLVLIFCTAVFYYTGNAQIAERAGAWVWICLVLTVIFEVLPTKTEVTRKQKRHSS